MGFFTGEKKDLNIDEFKKYGGVLPEEKYTEQLKFWLNSLNVSFGEILKGGNGKPEVKLEYINNSDVNATVCKKGDMYIIGIFLGFIYVVNDLFFRMLSSPNILTAHGDPTKETVRKIHNAQITDSAILYIALHGDERAHPMDEVRTKVAILLSTFSINNLVLHEYAHIMLGHVDYSINEAHQSMYFEDQHNSTYKNHLEPSFQQNAELAADSYAVNLSIANLLSPDFRNESINEKIRLYLNEMSDRVFLWNFAIYSQKRLFGYRKYQYEELLQLTHPPPSLRQHIIMGLIKKIISVNFSNFNFDIENILKNSVLEVEAAFSEISQQPFDMDSYQFVFDPEMEKYFNNIKDNYSNVISLLTPFTYEKY